MAENVPTPGQEIAQAVAAEQSAAIDSSAMARQREGMISELTVDVCFQSNNGGEKRNLTLCPGVNER